MPRNAIETKSLPYEDAARLMRGVAALAKAAARAEAAGRSQAAARLRWDQARHLDYLTALVAAGLLTGRVLF